MIQIEKIIKRLHEQNAAYVIIGGIAGVAHGSAYITNDLDICYARTEENFIALEKTFLPFHPKLRDAPSNLPFHFDRQTIKAGLNFTLTTDLGDIDLWGEVQGIGLYKKVLEKSEPITLYNISCRILSLEGLIDAKKAAGRPKDLLHLKELEALQEIKKKI